VQTLREKVFIYNVQKYEKCSDFVHYALVTPVATPYADIRFGFFGGKVEQFRFYFGHRTLSGIWLY
jgi:hypothetical protein